MKDSKTLKSKKHSKESYYKRREYGGNKETISESHYYKSVVKEGNRKEVIEEQKSRRKTKDNSRHPSHSDRHKHQESKREDLSPPIVRRDYRRNSPVEVPSGCRNTDSGSSNESEEENHHKKNKNKHKSRRHRNESYEELSRRKRKIESELHALDMEEAAQKQAESKKKPRDISDHHKKRKTTSVYIKEEPVSDEPHDDRKRSRLSDDEHRHKHKRPVSRSPNFENEKDWGKQNVTSKKNEKPKEKPNFSVSGKLAEDTNTYNGVVIKYNEPIEARKPRRKWRLYPFKGDSSLPFIPIHRQSAYLFGRTRLIADIPIDHPSCSKQHAVLQFRMVSYKRDDGSNGKRVRPYIIDLESSNGTFVNNKKIDSRRYIELMEKDVVKFGFSSREYVVLHEESKNDFEDDDVTEDKSE